jgi:hypothetical protein
MDKFRGAMERITESAEPAAPYEWPEGQPWALLVESEHRPGSSQNSSADGDGLADLAMDAVSGIPYRFMMEVHRPGLAAYRIEQRERIPSKVQRTWTQGEQHVPAGTEVPLRVTGPGEEDVEIDWEGYLAMPGRKQQAERLRGEAQMDHIAAEFERTTKPAQVQKIRANTRMAALTSADMVLAGQLSREQFDQSMGESVRMGHLLPEDLAEAVAKLGG